VIYPDAYGSKLSLLDRAFREALPSLSRNRKYLEFCDRHRFWLDDYALYEALHQDQGGGWRTWPPDLRDRGGGLEQERERLEEDVRRQKFYQYLFFRQWLDLRDHCSKQGILLVGDVPVYVSYNSADVWAHRALFNLDEQGDPVTVSGVPPDYFSETGQLWNNPIFRWDRLKRDGYGWWVRRMKHNLLLFDWVRLDHFRGFEAFWEVPAGESTAINGSWTPGPGRDFFETLRKHAPGLPFIAEDLGVITEEVTSLRDAFGMPGMRVLQFGFGDGDYHLPHRYEQNFVAYTGTHDNNTLVGWMRSGELNGADRKRALKYAGAGMFGLRSARWDFIRMLMASRAGWVIIPLQDVLGLGGRCRMNSPSTSEGNWEWRLHPGGLKKPHAVQLGEMSGLYGRNDR
jgi:4-alpha-glucanotransferase